MCVLSVWPCPVQGLLAQVQELEKWSRRRAAIGQAKEELRALVKAVNGALEHNDK